jgi:hypothetical protein
MALDLALMFAIMCVGCYDLVCTLLLMHRRLVLCGTDINYSLMLFVRD